MATPDGTVALKLMSVNRVPAKTMECVKITSDILLVFVILCTLDLLVKYPWNQQRLLRL